MWIAQIWRRLPPILSLGLGLILAGCAGPPVASEQPLPPPVTPTNEQVPGPAIIPFFTTETDPEQIATLQTLIAEYQATNPDVVVEIVPLSPTIRGRRLLTALAAGADLGIFEIEPTFMTDWAEAGYLLPLDDVVEAIGPSDYVPGSLFRYDGAVYALPYATSVYGLWVRTDRLAEHGLPIPETYDDVVAAARTLTDGTLYGIALPAGQNIASVNYFSTFLWQNDADYFTCEGEVAFATPEALDAVTKWAELLQYAPPGAATWGYAEQIDAFLRGRVAMAMYGGRLGVHLAAQAPELEDNTTVIFPPWGPEEVTLGVWSRLAIASGTTHQREARAFLSWLLSGDRLLRFDLTVPGHMIPPLQSVQVMVLAAESPYVRQHGDWLRSFLTWAEITNHPVMNMGSVRGGHFTRSELPTPWGSAIFGTRGVISTMLQAIALGKSTPEAAWRHAVDEMETVVAAWKAEHPEWRPPVCQ